MVHPSLGNNKYGISIIVLYGYLCKSCICVCMCVYVCGIKMCGVVVK